MSEISEVTLPSPIVDELPPAEQDLVRPQTTSDLLKIQRALGGDTMWGLRLEIAFKIAGEADTASNRIEVTKACVENIYCDVEGTVSTEGVTDEELMAAIEALEG